MPDRDPFPDPFAPPSELVEAINDDETCVMLTTDQGTALFATALAGAIADLRRTIPIQVRHTSSSAIPVKTP